MEGEAPPAPSTLENLWRVTRNDQHDAKHPDDLAKPVEYLIDQQGIAKPAFAVINQRMSDNLGQTNRGDSSQARHDQTMGR